MKNSEVISKLQEIQNEHGDIQVLALENTWGECKKFLYEDIDGYGYCGKKDNEVCYCGDKCHITHGKP